MTDQPPAPYAGPQRVISGVQSSGALAFLVVYRLVYSVLQGEMFVLRSPGTVGRAVAGAVAATVLYVMAMGFGAPISTTHTITSSVMGVGATKRASAVRWGVARSIVAAWVITIPAAAFAAAHP